jgi:predicted GNAT family acetyltransferase
MSTVTDNKSANRYELEVEGRIAFVRYRHGEGVISLDHAEVPRELEGRGIGSRLVAMTLDAIRAEGKYKVMPRCSFVATFIRRKPEYQDLMA